MILIIANILSLLGNTLFSLSSLVKNKKKILIMQNTNHLLSATAEILQEAYSAPAQELTSFIRNIILLFVKETKRILKLIISIITVIAAVVLGVLLNIFLNNNVWYGYLPIIANILYSTGVILAFMIINISENKRELIIKIALILNSIIWIIYGFFIKLYPVIIFNFITLILSIIAIIRIVKVNKKTQNNEVL